MRSVPRFRELETFIEERRGAAAMRAPRAKGIAA